MIHEYAVSPQLFGVPELLHLFRAGFDGESGRLVSEYPRRSWMQYARHYIEKHVSDGALQRAWKELLVHIERHSFYSRQAASWDGNVSWVDNAIVEHAARAFRAILSTAPFPGHPEVLQTDYSLHTAPAWLCPATITIAGRANTSAAALVAAVAPLIAKSTRLVLVDRNFVPSHARFINVLKEFARVVAGQGHQPRIQTIIYVTAYAKGPNDRETPNGFETACRTFVGGTLPAGVSVKFILKPWSLMHARFVIGNDACVSVDPGLDEGADLVVFQRHDPTSARGIASSALGGAVRTFVIA